jgi:peptidoglycan/LPS O-acetylase OafA/YrhL
MKGREFLYKFQRITSSNEFIPQIDGLRFIAISAVFLFHLQGKLIKNLVFVDEPNSYLFQKLLLNGDFGVELFFVISGFILAMPFAKYYLGLTDRKMKLKSYFLRRLTRLEPPYFLALLGCFFIHVMLTRQMTFKEQLPHLISAFFYTHNIIFRELLPINLVTWSLEIEVQFYVLTPLLVKVFSLKALHRRLIILCAILIIPLLNNYYPLNVMTIYSFLHFFLIGFLLVDVFLTIKSIKIPTFISLPVGLFLLFAIFFFKHPGTLVMRYFHLTLIFLFYLLVLKENLWMKLMSNLWLTTIGGMCYTIYLFHFPIQGFAIKSVLNFPISRYYIPNFLFQLIFVGTFVLVISALFFYYIEKPCMQKDWYKNISIPILYRNNRKAA